MRSRLMAGPSPFRPAGPTVAALLALLVPVLLAAALAVYAVRLASARVVVAPPVAGRPDPSSGTPAGRIGVPGSTFGTSPRRDGRGGREPVSPFERGVAAYNADDAEGAVDAFEEAVRLAPDASEAHINLGLVYLRVQRPEDAMRELVTGASLAKSGAER